MNGTRDRFSERGSAIILVVMMVSLLLLIPVSMDLLRRTRREVKHQLNVSAQADNIAQAGIMHAVSWFMSKGTVRQGVPQAADHPFYPSGSFPAGFPYPDAAFCPLESTDPTKNETMDQDIGIVREFPISEGGNTSLWARYEIPRQTVNNDPDPTNLLTQERAAHDISHLRVPTASPGDGLAWTIQSIGYVYWRRNPSLAFNVDPNEVVAQSRLVTEIRKLEPRLPAPLAALAISNHTSVSVSGSVRITGNEASPKGAGMMSISNPGTYCSSRPHFSGTPSACVFDSAYVFSIPAVFGVSDQELQQLADLRVTGANLPNPYPASSLVYVQGNASFDGSRRLRGGGVLVVTGDLTAAASSVTSFNGIIYVGGNATLTGPALVSGALIVRGTLTLAGGVDVADIVLDRNVIETVKQQLLAYRQNRSATFVFDPKLRR